MEKQKEKIEQTENLYNVEKFEEIKSDIETPEILFEEVKKKLDYLNEGFAPKKIQGELESKAVSLGLDSEDFITASKEFSLGDKTEAVHKKVMDITGRIKATVRTGIVATMFSASMPAVADENLQCEEKYADNATVFEHKNYANHIPESLNAISKNAVQEVERESVTSEEEEVSENIESVEVEEEIETIERDGVIDERSPSEIFESLGVNREGIVFDGENESEVDDSQKLKMDDVSNVSLEDDLEKSEREILKERVEVATRKLLSKEGSFFGKMFSIFKDNWTEMLPFSSTYKSIKKLNSGVDDTGKPLEEKKKQELVRKAAKDALITATSAGFLGKSAAKIYHMVTGVKDTYDTSKDPDVKRAAGFIFGSRNGGAKNFSNQNFENNGQKE